MSAEDLRARKASRYRQLFAGIFAFVVVTAISFFAIWLASSDARREIDNLAVANADSSQWSLAQLEVEYLKYRASLLAAVADREDLSEVRRRFDVFYSRVQTVKNSRQFEEVLLLPEARSALVGLENLLDDALPYIDGPDDQMRAALPDLLDRVDREEQNIRTIPLAGVEVLAQRSKMTRQDVAGALTNLGAIALVLLVILLAVVAVLMSLTRASRRQAAEIERTKTRLQSIIATSLEGIIVADRNGRVLDFNGASEKIFGYSRDEAIGKNMADLIVPPHLREAHEKGMKRYRETGKRRVVGSGLHQLEAMRKGGAIFPCEFSINGAQTDHGEIFVSFLRDVSERVASEHELVEARDKAVAGEKAKADLLAVMSHEMRTPLNGVLGTLQLLADTDLDERQRGFVDVMDTSGQTLLEHVNNVLDISRIDAGMAKPATQVFDVPKLVSGIADSLRTQAATRGNTIDVSAIGDVSGRVTGDMPRLRQILFNLIGNAIKFTENGKVTIEFEREEGSDEVEFRVVDSGIGISEDDMGRIFEDFVTLDASYQRAVEGTGLGLGIVRRLVTMLGGEVGVESDIGEGSVFWFRVPLPRSVRTISTRPEQIRELKVDMPRRDVLVVEDNEINRMVVREMLAQMNCKVTEARDGKEGVVAAQERKFDLILMDISMPRMDGTTATENIRNGDGPNKATPIVALTAHALPDDIKRFQESGMSDVVTKPLSRERLTVVLGDLGKVDEPAKPASSAREELDAVLGAEAAVEFVGKATDELKNGLEELRELLASEASAKDVSALAHKLSGTAALVGFEEVHGWLKAIETQADALGQADLEATIGRIEEKLRAA